MALVDNIILDNLKDFNKSIKDEFSRKGINDTGDASDSLKELKTGEQTYASKGNDYIEVLDRGRGPGRFAPVDNIRDWVRSKLGITEEKELKQVAFLVNRKLAREGSGIFKDKKKGLEINEKIVTLRKNLTKDLRVFAIADVKRQLNKFQSQTI
jgi:hypothetical protein